MELEACGPTGQLVVQNWCATIQFHCQNRTNIKTQVPLVTLKDMML